MIFLILFIIGFYLYSIKPNLSRVNQMKSFENTLLTHRGFYNNVDIPENSLKAFKKTVKNNYGTELDVQITTDNKLVVFHDQSLKRMCGIDKNLTDCSYEELLNYNLLNTKEKIPLFEDVLKVLKEDTPLIIEIKAEGDYIKTTDETIKMMNKYKRNYTMESFNPLVVKHLKNNYPHILRGQLSYDMVNDKTSNKSLILKFILTNYMMNFITKPDYCAYDVNNMNNLSFKIISKLYKAECVAWTIKSQDQLNKSKKYYKQFIFDSFDPKQNH